MHRPEDIAIAGCLLLPFLLFYFAGVAVRLGRDNRTCKALVKSRFGALVLGEAIPGMFEAILTLTAMFGVVFQGGTSGASPEGSLPHLMSLIASAAFLSYRGGYTYRESFLRMDKDPPQEEGAVAPTGTTR